MENEKGSNGKQQIERFRTGISLHTSRALDALAAGRPGDLIDREQMTKIVGRSCEKGEDGNGKSNVCSAIRICEQERGIVWRWSSADSAWKCFNPKECVGEGTKSVSKAARAVNRGLRVIATVDPAVLDEETRREYSLTCAIAGVMRIAGHGGARKKLEKAEITEPNTQKVLELMKR